MEKRLTEVHLKEVRNTIATPSYEDGLDWLTRKHRTEDLVKLREVIYKLQHFQITNQRSDHTLKGNLKPYKDIHISHDVILLYRYVGKSLEIDLELSDLGDHDHIFSKRKRC